MRRRRFLSIIAGAASLPMTARGGPLRGWQGTALGAGAEVTLIGGPPGAADAVIGRLPALLDDIENEFSLFRPDSALSRLNATGRLASSSRRFRAVIAACNTLHRATGGLFDPTVQPLWLALAQGRDPAPARALIGWHRVGVTPDAITLAPGQALTLNGIAQGAATDAVRDLLAEHGFTDALVNIGEHAALGGPWRIGIEDPMAGQLATRTLSGGAIATSSPFATLVAGQPHILHPTGGTPRWSTVSVEADTATLADALSTALVLADRDLAKQIRRDVPGIRRIVLVDFDGNLETPG